MPVNLSIKEVPDALAERLRKRAERHHRSLQGELMAIIESASTADAPLAESSQRPGFAFEPQAQDGGKTIEQLASAQRRRFPKPCSGGPLAVDIIRADRDSR